MSLLDYYPSSHPGTAEYIKLCEPKEALTPLFYTPTLLLPSYCWTKSSSVTYEVKSCERLLSGSMLITGVFKVSNWDNSTLQNSRYAAHARQRHVMVVY